MNIYNFITDFNLLMNADKYISKREVDSMLSKYESILSDTSLIEDKVIKKKTEYVLNNISNIVAIKNEKFISSKLIEYKDYFDNMFKGIDDSIVLDQEQRLAILTDEDYSLVIAGAGSGKTTTMAAKVKYLVEKMHVKEDKIILLAFTNKACEELQTRINEDFHLNVEVLTFHKLGMKFLRKIINKPITVIGPGTFNKIVEDYIINKIFKDKEKLRDFMETFKGFVFFDDKALSYYTFDEYYKYYADKTYELNKDNLKQYCDIRIKTRLDNYRSITGEVFRSTPEAMIANYLYINSIGYTYEKAYPHKLEEDRSYIPDFTIDNNGRDVYVEYYGLTKYHRNGNYSQDEIDFYKKLIDKKRELHEKYGTDLIELYSEYDFKTNYLIELDKELNKRFITKIPKTYKEIFYKLLYTSREVQYFQVINLFEAFITRFKEKGYTLEDFDSFIDNEKDEKIKKQLKYIKEVYVYYENSIHSENKIDFQDMINYAYRFADKVKNASFDYIIIDEYQDISRQRYNFAKRISDLFKSKIVAVGDDWQAIYGFSGSDVELFTKFYELMGYAEIVKIKNTYRNSQELLDVTSDFVSKDQTVFNKELKSIKHLDKPIEIYYYDYKKAKSKYETLVSLIKRLYEENNDAKILLLGRFLKEKDELINSRFFVSGEKDKIICRKVLNANIDFLTVHKSKGLGYDQVIILNGINGLHGFPSQVKDEEVLKVLDEKREEEDNVNFPEERRLFYVALTRTKNRVYILCPYLPMDRRSEFVREIESNDNVSRNLAVFKEEK